VNEVVRRSAISTLTTTGAYDIWCTSSGIGRHGKDASRHGLLELGGEVAPALLAAPMPLVAPVTTATRPVSRRGIVSGVAVVSVLVRTPGPESGR
jgi:hypothetical protein